MQISCFPAELPFPIPICVNLRPFAVENRVCMPSGAPKTPQNAVLGHFRPVLTDFWPPDRLSAAPARAAGRFLPKYATPAYISDLDLRLRTSAPPIQLRCEPFQPKKVILEAFLAILRP